MRSEIEDLNEEVIPFPWVMKYFPFISPAKTPTIIPETRQGVRHGESEGRPRRVLRGPDDIDALFPCQVVGVMEFVLQCKGF